MPTISCLPRNDPSNNYNYCPSLTAAILFAILFALVTSAHIIQAFIYRHRPSWVLIMAGCWEISGYISRSISISHQTNSGVFIAQFLLILLAPLWINAFVYMVLGRMVHFFMIDDRIFGVRARRITLIFVLFDITAFVVQLVGGIMTSGTDQPAHTVQLGLNIYTGGVALQLAFIAIFVCLALRFQQLLKRQGSTEQNELKEWSITDPAQVAAATDLPAAGQQHCSSANRGYHQAKPLLRTLWVTLFLIILRNIFRLVEYAAGGINGNTMTRHEWYQYVFDAIPMFFAMVTLALYHPGRVLKGERSDFSEEDKSRRTDKKARKQEKGEVKRVKKEARLSVKRRGEGQLSNDTEAQG